jgi:hypothetical protein
MYHGTVGIIKELRVYVKALRRNIAASRRDAALSYQPPDLALGEQ